MQANQNDNMLDLFIYSDVLPTFKANGYPENKYPYKEVDNSLENFSNIKKLTKGC